PCASTGSCRRLCRSLPESNSRDRRQGAARPLLCQAAAKRGSETRTERRQLPCPSRSQHSRVRSREEFVRKAFMTPRMCPEAFFQDKSGEIAAIHIDSWQFVVDDPSMRAHSRKAGL